MRAAIKDFEEMRSGVDKTPDPAFGGTLAEEARYGLLGDALEVIEPNTEADPVAVLINLLVSVGNAAGRSAHVRVGADRHGLNLNAVLVGSTAKGRKGMSWNFVRDLMHACEPFWVEERVLGGLSCGEGLIYAVRDRLTSVDKNGDSVVVDEGVSDKRLLAVESEWAGPLKMITREGNTLSAIIRQAWDGGKLQTLTRNSPLKATDPHVSIIGHVTKDEVLRHLSENDTSNGFANRFLWLMVGRSRILPWGGEWSQVNMAPLVKRLREALDFAKGVSELKWGESARDIWAEIYAELSDGESGLFGAATSRAEAQVLRLSAIYAVMDRSHTIEADHLKGGLAVWEYAEDSARYIFGDISGDPVADRIMNGLREKPEGMSRTEITHLFGRHRSAARIELSLSALERQGRVWAETKATGGRPAERWFAK